MNGIGSNLAEAQAFAASIAQRYSESADTCK